MSRALAVARAWGVPRTLLVALLLSVAAQLFAASYVGLPSFAADIPALDLVPPAAALLLAGPLVDQTPELTLHAVRPLVRVQLLRYAVTHGAGAVVVASLASTAWTLERATAVVVFLAAAALVVAALGAWYWVPLLAASYVWLLRSQQLDDVADADVPLAVGAAALVLGGLGYVAVTAWRASRPRRRGRFPRRPC